MAGAIGNIGRELAAFASRVRSVLRVRLSRPAWREAPALEPMPIAPLVSPLRCDIDVRVDLFRRCRDERDEIRRDATAFVERAFEHPYYTWFKDFRCPIAQPDLLHSPPKLERAFRDRVRKVIALDESFEAKGFDSKHPIRIVTADEILPTKTGKRIAGPYFAGDGCHRIALLLAAGYTEIPTAYYVREIHPTWRPLDATHVLIQKLGLSKEWYVDFLARGYAGGASFDGIEALEGWIREHAPDRAEEFRSVLDADLASATGSAWLGQRRSP